MTESIPRCDLDKAVSLVVLVAAFSVCQAAIAAEPIFPIPARQDGLYTAIPTFDRVLFAQRPVTASLGSGRVELTKDPTDGEPCLLVTGQQVGLPVEEPLFVTPSTRLSWAWKKQEGAVCIAQIQLRNASTGQTRYLGYAAGAWSEPLSADPTVEFTVSPEVPRQWTSVQRNLYDDMNNLLGWKSAQITEFYLSPWDGLPGSFRQAALTSLTATDIESARVKRELAGLACVGQGDYTPLLLKGYDQKHVALFETSFEECAPGRNSGANEWSAFGAEGNMDFNAMGRDMHVRYPAFDLVFRLDDGGREIKPDELESFRLGLVDNRLPAIWGGWEHGRLLYKVSTMTVPGPEHGSFDLYKLQIQNLGEKPLASKLAAIVEGPPDMRLEQGLVHGLGEAPFLIADVPAEHELAFRDWGLCDKRAKAYVSGGGPGKTEPAIARYRLGLDGLPVVYRLKAEAAKKYLVYLVSTPHISGHLLEKPEKLGDLVFEYSAEGCDVQTLDWIECVQANRGPLVAAFEAAHDTNGDGYIEVASGVSAGSRIRHTRLSAIYVFPEGTQIEGPESVYSGAMNSRCVWHVDVGATPEQGPTNQHYDKSDLGFARLKLRYSETIPPQSTRTFWLKTPSIHRREPVSMGYIAHAFRDVLPGEAVPPLTDDKLQALRRLDPRQAEQQVFDHWNRFFSRATRFDLPDPILVDVFLSRLATRAILDVAITDDAVYNPCSPFFYFDHAYRDQAYVIYAMDLAGLHQRAERLLRVYCMDVENVPTGPIGFDGTPLQLGMLPDGLWYTRPGQYDTQGQNIWAMVQHYKLSGDRQWLQQTAYPYVRRGAMWIVNSRRKHMEEVNHPADPRYGLIEPGGMEVLEVGDGMHMYYMNGFAILGLREAADAARSLGVMEDYNLFSREARELKESLHKSLTQTFKRTGLYDGYLWFGVEPEGVGMYGFWAHNCLVWPCRSIDPHDPMLTATWRRMDSMSNRWGGGMHSEGEGSFWPYIGVDRAVSYLLRGEPDKTLDYFCAFTDTAGGTLSWGEGYNNVIAAGDQPHFWADGQWLNLFRQLFAFEDGSSLWITPALFRRWHQGGNHVAVTGLPTHFGDLDLEIRPATDGKLVDYRIHIAPKGDQSERPLDRLVLYPRLAGGRPIHGVSIDGKPLAAFSRDSIVVPEPPRGVEIRIRVETGDW